MVYSQNVKVPVYVKTDHNWNVSKRIREILVRSSGNSFLKEQLPNMFTPEFHRKSQKQEQKHEQLFEREYLLVLQIWEHKFCQRIQSAQ